MTLSTRLDRLSRARGRGLRGDHPGDGADADPGDDALVERCRESFREWCRHWQFRDTERGRIATFGELWAGQEQLAEVMQRERWVFALKGGKLGFSELECAWDGWVARFGPPHSRVHLFSRGASEAADLLGRVRFGLLRLPAGLRWPFLGDVAGADTTRSLKVRDPADTDDVRTITSYPASPTSSIDATAQHCHVDELAHMIHAREVWASVPTTIAPGGSLHVITRGSGQHHYAAELWTLAGTPDSPLFPFFAAYDQRPGRDRAWRERQASLMHPSALQRFAPLTPEDALSADEEFAFIDAATWDRCYDPDLPPLDARTPIVLAVDIGLKFDHTAIVAASRHPLRTADPAVRAVKTFRPQDSGGVVSLDDVEAFLRQTCEDYAVAQIAFDPWQGAAIFQRLERDGIAWVSEFGQTAERAQADSALAQLCLQRRLSHTGDAALRQAILNAVARYAGTDDRTIRMVKSAPDRHIDAAVAASMAVSRALALNL